MQLGNEANEGKIVSEPKNYPKPYYRKNGIDWKNVAWKSLGTPQRMERLGKLIDDAKDLARTEQEKHRVALWEKAL